MGEQDRGADAQPFGVRAGGDQLGAHGLGPPAGQAEQGHAAVVLGAVQHDEIGPGPADPGTRPTRPGGPGGAGRPPNPAGGRTPRGPTRPSGTPTPASRPGSPAPRAWTFSCTAPDRSPIPPVRTCRCPTQ